MPLERFWNGKPSGILAALWYFAAAAYRRIVRVFASQFQCSRLGKCGRGCRIGLGVTLCYPGRIEFGDGVRVGDDVFISSEFSTGCCKIAENVHIDRLSRLDFSGELHIGRNVTISEAAVIETHSHGYDPHSRPATCKVEIGENVWIGMRAMILPQTGTIGANAIIGAGAVVTKPVPPNAVVAGNPARIVGSTSGK